MSEAYDKGRNFERKVASMLRSKLKIAVQRDRRSGANWTNKSDISDYWNELPLHLEIKDHENIKVKEWFRQADAGASFSKAPTVVFAMDEEILTVIRFSDLLNFLIEITDLRAENDDLRAPLKVPFNASEVAIKAPLKRGRPKGSKNLKAEEKRVAKLVDEKIGRGDFTCRNGHLSDDFGYCMQKGCPFSRGYKKKKTKK